jgi:MFS family permease
VLQGIGAAFLMPNSLAILGATFDGKARGKAIGIWAAAGAAAGAIGPLLGGWLIDTVGWRAVFYINLPIAALAMFLGWRYVRVPRGEKPVALDPAGALLASVGLGCLTWGLAAASADKGVTTATGGAMAAGALVLLGWRAAALAGLLVGIGHADQGRLAPGAADEREIPTGRPRANRPAP